MLEKDEDDEEDYLDLEDVQEHLIKTIKSKSKSLESIIDICKSLIKVKGTSHLDKDFIIYNHRSLIEYRLLLKTYNELFSGCTKYEKAEKRAEEELEKSEKALLEIFSALE